MRDSETGGLLPDELTYCQTLLHTKQQVPVDSLFDDRYFRQTCKQIENENETRVIRDISLLIVPSAEVLAIRGNPALACLKESTNAGWNKSWPIEGPRPQPDYSVGFRISTFSDEERKKLELKFDLKFDIKSYFAATEIIYFPFLTCEVKCGNQTLVIADRQNAHSMTIAARAISELYRKVGREQELHRKALAFSISHDHRSVGIYAHYLETDGQETSYYRHQLKSFDFQSEDGKDRWAAYQFTRNLYENFAPKHLERIKSAINQLPKPGAELAQSALGAEEANRQQETATSAASQEVGVFKKPAIPQTSGTGSSDWRREKDQLMEQMEKQRKDAEQLLLEQMEKQRQDSEQQLAEQMEKQKQEVELLRKDLMDLLERQKDK